VPGVLELRKRKAANSTSTCWGIFEGYALTGCGNTAGHSIAFAGPLPPLPSVKNNTLTGCGHTQ
jgi:hypothetical protein